MDFKEQDAWRQTLKKISRVFDMIPPKWTLEKVKTLEVFIWIEERNLQKKKRSR